MIAPSSVTPAYAPRDWQYASDVSAVTFDATWASPAAVRPTGPSATLASPPIVICLTAGSAKRSICIALSDVTMSETSAPTTAPNVTPIVPTAHGADHEPSGSRATTRPVPMRSPPMNATLPTVRNSSPCDDTTTRHDGGAHDDVRRQHTRHGAAWDARVQTTASHPMHPRRVRRKFAIVGVKRDEPENRHDRATTVCVVATLCSNEPAPG